jgi:hypothetical protein
MCLPRVDTAQLTLVRQPFEDRDFLFELKHDGFGTLAYISDGQCELILVGGIHTKVFKTFEKTSPSSMLKMQRLTAR